VQTFKNETNYENIIDNVLEQNNLRVLGANASIEDFEKEYEAVFEIGE